MRKPRKNAPSLILLVLLTACGQSYDPKPKAYPKVYLPEKAYKTYSSPECPFRFDYPVYAKVVRDSLFFQDKVENPCWLDIDFAGLHCKIHLTYKAIDAENTLEKSIEDTHRMTFKHTKKANYINESLFTSPSGATGIIYQVGGDAASAVQFYITDEVAHFMRGSLYFRNNPNADSLKPVIDFVRADLDRMINTFSWDQG